MSKAKVDLMPCPFCGKQPEIHTVIYTPNDRGQKVACLNQDCWAQPGVLGVTRTIAAKNWNTRPRRQRNEP